MRLGTLIEELLHLQDQLGDNVEVRLAHQPRWPFEYSVSDVVHTESEKENVVYIAEGVQLDYLPSAARDELGW